MDRCLSTIELEELLAGVVEPAGEAPLTAHLDGCAHCQNEFNQRTVVRDSLEWQYAAQAELTLTATEQDFLDQLKRPESYRLPNRSEGGPPESDWFQWDSLNGKRNEAVAVIRRENPAMPLPEVPGFEIISQLGRGGMGVVYKARQVAQDRIVALKMILAGNQASEEDLGRFYDEAHAVARLRHPHIVQLYEVGQFEGRLFFALEFVEGGTLADLIRRQPMPPRASAQLLEALARAMDYAHSRDIIHRDLKPANVLLHGRRAFLDVPQEADRMPTDWDFRRFMPKITDFGLAKLLDRGTGHTSSGDVLGTPSYMAPEQAQGKPYPIGPTTDVYSLGAILYELLTAKPPFQGPTPMDTLFMVHTQEPEPPRRINKDVPARLEAICLKCLKKSPGDRYATAENLADDLRLFLEGQPVRARGQNLIQSTWTGLRKKTGTLIFAILAAVLAVIAGAAMTYQWRQANDRELELQRIRAGQAAAEQELFRLRFDRAVAACEIGQHGRGLLDLAELLQEVREHGKSPDLIDLMRLNLAAWSQAAPHLKSVETVPMEELELPVREPIARSHDGQFSFTGGADGTLRVRMDGRLTAAVQAHRQPITMLSASPARSLLLTGAGSEAKLWRTDRLELLAAFSHPQLLRAAGFADDGRSFFTTDTAGTRRTWNVPADAVIQIAAGEKATDAAHPPKPADGFDLESDQRLLASSNDGWHDLVVGADSVLRLRSTLKKNVQPLTTTGARCNCANFSPDGVLLVTGCGDGVRVWHVPTGKLVGPTYRLTDIASVRVAGDGRQIIASTGRQSWTWTLPAATDMSDPGRSVRHITGVVRTPDGLYYLVGPTEWTESTRQP